MRLRWVTVLVIGLGGVLPSDAGAVGELDQKTAPAGCVSNDTAGGQCRQGDSIGVTDVAFSPDGKSAYVVRFGPPGALTIFDRDATDGSLTQKPGMAGCVVDGGS